MLLAKDEQYFPYNLGQNKWKVPSPISTIVSIILMEKWRILVLPRLAASSFTSGKKNVSFFLLLNSVQDCGMGTATIRRRFSSSERVRMVGR